MSNSIVRVSSRDRTRAEREKARQEREGQRTARATAVGTRDQAAPHAIVVREIASFQCICIRANIGLNAFIALFCSVVELLRYEALVWANRDSVVRIGSPSEARIW